MYCLVSQCTVKHVNWV